jgi:hypothetical protein
MIKKRLPTGKGRGPYPVNDQAKLIEFYFYELDQFFGFAEAEVLSPPDVKTAKALPFKNTNNNLILSEA